ncbi:MAG: phosphoglucosamine mutase [Myxococcota bacterium]
MESRFGHSQWDVKPGRRALLNDPAAAWRKKMPSLDLSGVRILLDCAHGAAAPHAPGVLESMGATVIRRGCEPDGRNINDGVGAMHPPEDLRGCDLAICLDGDADRLMMVVPGWGTLDGDDMLWLLSQSTTGPVVGTVMTNGGLEAALGGRLHRAKVGDKNVAELMSRTGAQLGAEPSGHILFADGMPTGDGLYAALRILQSEPGSQTPRLLLPLAGWKRLPTLHRNLRFEGTRHPLDTLSTPDEARAAGQRVIIRYSGTEPLLRILVEGEEAQTWTDRIVTEFEAR